MEEHKPENWQKDFSSKIFRVTNFYSPSLLSSLPPACSCVSKQHDLQLLLQLKQCALRHQWSILANRKGAPVDQAVCYTTHYWNVMKSEVTGWHWLRNTMKKQMLELNLLSARLSGLAGDSSVSLCNHMGKLSLGTLTTIRAKCDTGMCISYVSSLPCVNSAFCLSELVGPLQRDQEADAQWVSFPSSWDMKCSNIQ